MRICSYILWCDFRFGQPIKVNWAYASGQREDTSGLFVFVYINFLIVKIVVLLKTICHLVCFITLLSRAGHFNIFVGDLSPEVTDATLFACFSVYGSCS